MKALIITLLLAASAFAGPPTPFPETVEAITPPASIVRVFAFDETDETRNSGTGTLIRQDLVVTAAHVVGDKEGAKVEILFYSTWEVVLGTVVKISPNNSTDGRDVAIIELDNPRSEITMPLSDMARLGSVTIKGYSHGPYTERTGTYFTKDKSGRWGMIRGAQARNGDSGGPVVQDGHLVGVLWGSASDQTWFTPVEYLYELYPGLMRYRKAEVKPNAPTQRIRYSIR